MRLSRRIQIQLAIFTVVSLVAAALMVFGYMKLPTMLFGVGRYTVTVELPRSGGLYATGNVTYRGVEVGRIDKVRVTPTGVAATLSLKSGIDIPSDVVAEVHSVSAVGEQYVALLPRSGNSPALRDGDVITQENTSVPPDINSLLNAANTGLEAIPQDNLRTVINESYTAIGGLGPELARLVKGSTTLAIDAHDNLDALTTLIDQSGPVLDSQTNSADAISTWAAQIAAITTSLKTHDPAIQDVLANGGAAAAEASALIDRLRPTLPIVLANLVSAADVAVTYQAGLEQLLVLIPQGVALEGGIVLPNRNTKQDYRGAYLDFNLNLNTPPPCATGYLPTQQQRTPSQVDFPERVSGDLYCRISQDSPFGVRGVRNAPCATRPGKRAPTVKMCESDEQYVPLNDGQNWKGDPNATLSGQAIPQPRDPAMESAPAPVAVARYDPATGSYVGPDGKTYTQADLAQGASQNRTWQSMLVPPPGR